MLKCLMDLQSYNTINLEKEKNVMAIFRCKNLRLSIEISPDTWLRIERICMCCVNKGIRVIEDEYHLIFICPLYKHLRSTFLLGILLDYSWILFCNVMQ